MRNYSSLLLSTTVMAALFSSQALAAEQEKAPLKVEIAKPVEISRPGDESLQQQSNWYIQAGAGYGMYNTRYAEFRNIPDNDKKSHVRFAVEAGYQDRAGALGLEVGYAPTSSEATVTNIIPESYGPREHFSGKLKSENVFHTALTSRLYVVSNEKANFGLLSKLGVAWEKLAFSGTKTLANGSAQPDNSTSVNKVIILADIGASASIKFSDQISLEVQAVLLTIPSIAPYGTAAIKFSF